MDGDTHLVVDRPAGRHTISVYFIGLLATNVQHEAVVQIQAGTSTYFEVRQAETNTRATGRPVAGTAPNLFMFYANSIRARRGSCRADESGRLVLGCSLDAAKRFGADF